MLITYRAKDIDGAEFASYYYMSEDYGEWTKRPLVPIMKDGNSTGKLQGANPDALLVRLPYAWRRSLLGWRKPNYCGQHLRALHLEHDQRQVHGVPRLLSGH